MSPFDAEKALTYIQEQLAEIRTEQSEQRQKLNDHTVAFAEIMKIAQLLDCA